MSGGGLGQLVGLLVALPFVALADWFKFTKQLPPGQQELAKACHGIGMLALLAYAISLAGGLVKFIAAFVLEGDVPYWLIPLVIVAWSLGWFLLNARYAALSIGQPRATIIVRAMIKIGIGCAAWIWAASFDRSNGAAPLLGLLLHAVAVWCVATGGTKLGLMLWGRRRGQAEQMVARDIAQQEFNWDAGDMR